MRILRRIFGVEWVFDELADAGERIEQLRLALAEANLQRDRALLMLEDSEKSAKQLERSVDIHRAMVTVLKDELRKAEAVA